MPLWVRAYPGDTLCSIAVRWGKFKNCQQLRDNPYNKHVKNRNVKPREKVLVPDKKIGEGQGQVNEVHKFERDAGKIPKLRFVHGSKDKPYDKDLPLAAVGISQFRTDRSGLYQRKKFTNKYGFNKRAHVDPNTFKIEVTDPGASGDTVTVDLEALKPVYAVGGGVTHEPFADADPDADKRKKQIACKRVKSGSKTYRSKYLRLVTTTGDYDAVPDQTLLVTDMADGAGGDADRVEILDQKIRSSYELEVCPASDDAKCKAVCEIPVGLADQRRRVKLVVHVLEDVITVAEARKAALQYLRRLYAQIDMSVSLVGVAVRRVVVPGNMIAIENRTGCDAKGGEEISCRVKIKPNDPPASPEVTHDVTYTTVAGHTPFQSAEGLAQKIRDEVGAGVTVRTWRNPRIPGEDGGSADIIVGDPLTAKITISNLNSDDDTHEVELGEIKSKSIRDFAGDESHVGTPDERMLIKNYDTGEDRIDVFVVDSLAGAWGEAFTPDQDEEAAKRAISSMVNSVIIDKTCLEGANLQATLAHELGHVLTDRGHEMYFKDRVWIKRKSHRVRHEVMIAGGGALTGDDDDEFVVKGPKRISHPTNAQLYAIYEDTDVNGSHVAGSPMTFFRGRNQNVCDDW